MKKNGSSPSLACPSSGDELYREVLVELRQEHERRRKRLAVAISLVVGAVFLAILVFAKVFVANLMRLI